jgi:hypothetical protein
VSFDFSHMLDHTVHFGVEEAAMRRLDEDSDDESPPLAQAAAPTAGPQRAERAEETLRDSELTLVPPRDGPDPDDSLIDFVPVNGAARPDSPSPAPPDADATISDAQLRALLGARRGATASPTGPMVPAVSCGSGHPNPPEAQTCRSCGRAIIERQITQMPRPVLGRLRFDTGQIVDLDRPVVVGRKPPEDEQVNGETARPVVVPDPDQALSRVHAEVRLEGWQVLVVDRRSVNSTYVALPGKPPVQLRPNEPFLLVPGSNVMLGDVVSFTFEIERR